MQYVELIGRIMISLMFILAGFNKIGDPQSTAAYMASVGLPVLLVWPAIIFEIVAPIAVIVGWKTRIWAWLLAGYCVLTAVLFHNNFSDQMQMINFMKNLTIAGGFLLLAYHGGGLLSLDKRMSSIK
jgi:putative oxidoreductase